MILPTKFENERIMFTIDYGDMLPWGSVVELAKITVEVSSGNDPYPQRVFSQTWDIEGTIVTYQVRRGIPGVIYRLLTAVLVAGDWVYREVKLAIVPDHGDVGSLYPLTRIFTSLLYVQLIVEETIQTVFPTDGLLIRLLYDSAMQPDNVNQSLIPIDGDLFEVPPPEFVDDINQNLIPSNGDLKVPPLGELQDNVEPTLIPTGGELKVPPTGTIQAENVAVWFGPTGGELKLTVTTTVAALLHFDGPDGGTTFTDETGRVWTVEGTAQLDTAQAAFGSASALFGGTNAGLIASPSADFSAAHNDGKLTIEFWMRRSPTGRLEYIVCARSWASLNDAWVIELTSAGQVAFPAWSPGGVFLGYATSPTIDANTWTHVAVVVDGTTVTVFAGGVKGTPATYGGVPGGASQYVRIGRSPLPYEDNRTFTGHLDELRVTKGAALYTENFTPPTAPFTYP